MRLIDADKLYPDCMTKNGTLAISQSQIANAPTVTNGTYEQGFRVGAYGRLDELRPKGEWEYVQYDANPKIGNWHCSNCRYIPISIDIEHQKTNFCPNCGADMKGTRK